MRNTNSLDDLLAAATAAQSASAAEAAMDNVSAAIGSNEHSPPVPSTLFAGESSVGGESGITTVFEDATANSSVKSEKSKSGVPLISFQTKEDISNVCLGLIGGGSSKFCTKHNAAHQTSCGIASHLKRKFTIQVQHFYIKKTDAVAFCTPCISYDEVPPSQMTQFKTGTLSYDEWLDLFALCSNSSPGNNLQQDADFERKMESIKEKVLKTPKKVRFFKSDDPDEDGDETFVAPMDSIDLPANFDERTSELPSEIPDILKQIVFTLRDHTDTLVGVQRDIRATEKVLLSVSNDIELLDARQKRMDSLLGNALDPQLSPELSAFGNIEALLQTVNSMHKKVETSHQGHFSLSSQFTKTSDELYELKRSNQQDLTNLKNELQHHGDRWTKMSGIIKQVISQGQTLSSFPLASLNNRIQNLETKSHVAQTAKKSNVSRSRIPTVDDDLESLLDVPQKAGPPKPATTDKNALDMVSTLINSRLTKIEDTLSVLHARTSGDWVSLGQFRFQSLAELSKWLQLHVPNKRYGAFVDGVSIFQYFFSDHKDLEQVMSGFYNSSKAGFSTLHESKITASFQNVLPPCLGKGMDTGLYVPGLSTPEKWDNQDGDSGLRYRLDQEMNGVHTQISHNITHSLDINSPARNLAEECLQKSVHFTQQFSAWITRFFSQLLQSGSFDRAICWLLISRCIRRLFSDLADVRITARDMKDTENSIEVCAQYVWATLKTHRVMQEYLHYNIENHPSFSSVITRFVINNSFQSDVNSVASNVTKVDKRVDAVNKRLDKAFTALDKKQDKE